jgi:phosphatidylglycerol:prolipoprotein diacylglycerol transferase
VTVAAIQYPALDPIALRVGPFAVHWYGIAYLVGFAGAFFVMRWLVHRWRLNLTDDDLLTIVLAAIVGVLLGGRLGYVLFYGGSYYLRRPGQIAAIWDGGMSFHGGLAGILVAGVVVAATMRIPWLTLCDLGSVGAPIGFFFGRMANFVNQELWGRVTTVPWGVIFPNAGPLPRHPSQLYEAALEGVVLLAVLLWIATRRPNPPRGVVFGWLLTLYGVFRIAVEFFRQPDVQIGFLPGGATMGQLLSVPLVVVGVGVIVWSYRRGLSERGRPEAGR